MQRSSSSSGFGRRQAAFCSCSDPRSFFFATGKEKKDIKALQTDVEDIVKLYVCLPTIALIRG